MNPVNPGLFARWFNDEVPAEAGGQIHYLTERPDSREEVWESIVQAVRSHYIDRDALQAYCDELDYPGAAAAFAVMVPADPRSRSGELGEILATEYVNEQLEVDVHVKRMRNKDERNTALRGDDLLGVAFSDDGELLVLKGEAKSRQFLDSSVLDEAEAKLLQNDGRPSQHSLGFIATHLMRRDRKLASAVARYNLRQLRGTLSHLIVTLTQSKPRTLFPKRLRGTYPADISRKLVGMVITKHKETVAKVYEEVIAVDSIARELPTTHD